jgi:hypothetical protein
VLSHLPTAVLCGMDAVVGRLVGHVGTMSTGCLTFPRKSMRRDERAVTAGVDQSELCCSVSMREHLVAHDCALTHACGVVVAHCTNICFFPPQMCRMPPPLAATTSLSQYDN